MLSKLIKNDLKKNLKLLCFLFALTILVSAIARGCSELGKSVSFFKIVSIIFDSVFYGLAANTIIQTIIRNIINFTKSFYGDEAYLIHTLPATKTQLLNSKYITALIEVFVAFIVLIISILIRFASNNMFASLKLIISNTVVGNLPLGLFMVLFVLLIIVEFLMFISIIFFSIILAYKAKEKKVLKSFVYSALFAFVSLIVLSIMLIVVLLINKVDLKSSIPTLSSSAFLSIVIVGIAVYFIISTLFYLLARKEFNKGVNVD